MKLPKLQNNRGAITSKSDTICRSLLITASVLSLLSSCTLKSNEDETAKPDSASKNADKAVSEKDADAKAGKDTAGKSEKSDSTSTATATATSEGTNTATSSTADSSNTGATTTPTLADSSAVNTEAANSINNSVANTVATATGKTVGGANIAPGQPVNISLSDLPADVAICTVGGTNIKVGDYRRMLRLQQIQANQQIVMDPNAKAKFLEQANQSGITLTQEEKSKLLEAAHQEKGKSAKEFQEFLKKSGTTEQQFDNEIMQTGLAFKTSNAVIEKALLPDLVNRALLSQAAKAAGGEKEAMNKYLAFKHSQQFDEMLKQTGLSADALRDEMVQANLAQIQLAKLEPLAKVSPAELHKIYDQHKKELKHEERIRISTILVACPEKDVGPIASVRNQVKKANPKMTEKELDDLVKQIKDQQQQKALVCLGQAKGGGDFAKLANENSNDPDNQIKKNGGDLGWLEKKNLIPALADVVWKLKPGEVLTQIVKSDLGFTVYKVTGKEPAGIAKFDEVKPQIELLARQAKMQQVIADWLNNRRKVVKIEFTPKFLQLANAPAKAPAKAPVNAPAKSSSN